MGKTCIILLSGGLDSTTLLYRAIEDFGHNNVGAISLYYGQRHFKEVEIARRLCQRSGIPHTNHNISSVIGVGGLTDSKMEIPNTSYDKLEGVSPTYVPFRNGLLLSIATSLSTAQEGTRYIGYGAHAEDAENWAYPDCTPEFIGAMANAIYIGTYHKVRLYTPFMWSRKHDIVAEGWGLGVPFAETWSCYKGENLHCGTCPTCLARKEAFTRAGVKDPTVYKG